MVSIIRSNWFNRNLISLQRSIHTGHTSLISEKDFQKIKLKQAKMQCDDNVPVYLKCGIRDKILYWITLGLVAYSTIQSIKGLRQLIKQNG